MIVFKREQAFKTFHATTVQVSGINRHLADILLPLIILGASSQNIVSCLEADLQPNTSNPARIRTSYGGAARNVAEKRMRLRDNLSN